MSQSSEHSPNDKEHAPSQKKLDDARKQGDIAKSTELTAAAAYGGLLLAGVMGAGAVGMAAQTGVVLIDQAPDIARLASGSARTVVGGLLASVALPAALFLVLPAAASLLSLIAQRALVFVPSKLAPKLSRISPLSTAKQKFGASGLFEFAKSVVKLVLVALTLGWFLTRHADGLLATVATDPRLGILHLLALLGQFLGIAILLTLSLGAVDYLWQHNALMRRNRMSRKDMTDEQKDSDGDPHSKAQRRQRGQEIAMNQMLAEVAQANVIIVNPTHYSVALKWSRGSRTAPVVVAKGVDDLARRIRERAIEHAVPILSDPPTARALFASVDIGQPISREHFQAVAAAIRFAETMRHRAKGRI
ncbi:MAG: flagellar biosynthesis protein FlhB [Rhodobacteraceae bacterium]|nr:flagellar biosynthesis protein FlhB [Paracoccaceae bacterium]